MGLSQTAAFVGSKVEYLPKNFDPVTDTLTLILGMTLSQYQFYEINLSKNKMTLHITAQIFQFYFSVPWHFYTLKTIS